MHQVNRVRHCFEIRVTIAMCVRVSSTRRCLWIWSVYESTEIVGNTKQESRRECRSQADLTEIGRQTSTNPAISGSPHLPREGA